ncbi:hypothetical protein [Chryseobacterium sp. JK1]|uniref:hypothetical protein n=1 Tax=Chryseobacterium sp. JK1 TaxID=874294 RepID=UPI003D68DD1E
MIKFLVPVFISAVFAHAQQKAVSSFSIEEYKNMQDEYLRTVMEKKDQLLYLQNQYYSTQKLDSLLIIKDQIKRQYWIDNGKKAEEITKKDISSLKDEILLPQSIFKIQNNGNTFYCNGYEYAPQLFIQTKDGKSINFLFQNNEYTEGIQDHHTQLTTVNFYYPDYKLKRTHTIFKSSQNVGIFRQYDSSGKLINEIDWVKDFPVSEKQAQQIAQKEILSFLTHKYKDHPDVITNFKKN